MSNPQEYDPRPSILMSLNAFTDEFPPGTPRRTLDFTSDDVAEKLSESQAVESPRSPSAIESHPELYADIIAAGGLAAAMARTAAALGLEIGPVEAARDRFLADARIPSAVPGRAHLTITARRHRRLFSLDNHERGIAYARGRTPDLSELVRAAAAWYAGADSHAMKRAAAFIELPLEADARATGSARAVVEANWQLKRDAWARHWEYHPDGWQEHTTITALRALLDAAYAEPRLRRLYAVTSHHILSFSQCTDYPYARVGPAIEPRNDGHYRLWPGRDRRREAELFDTPDAAAERAAALLPPDCGDAVLGTAANLRMRLG